jgi:hypothetical protein
MNTAMSTKRSFVSERSALKPVVKSSEVQISLYAFVAGILLLIIGVKADISALMIVGFFFTASAGLALNSLFWASHFAKHGEPKFSPHWKYRQY